MKQNEQNKYKISQQTWLKCPEWIEIKKIEINLLQVIWFFEMIRVQIIEDKT